MFEYIKPDMKDLCPNLHNKMSYYSSIPIFVYFHFISSHYWIIYPSLSHTDFKLRAFSLVSNTVFASFSLVVGVFVDLGGEQLHAIANAGIREDEIFG